MEKPLNYPLVGSDSWSDAWTSNLFRAKVIGAAAVFVSILLFLPHFFSFIEVRQGMVLNDWFLALIPARDFSLLIFVFLWSSSLLLIVRCCQQPAIFLTAIYQVIIITLVRMVTISLFPLEAPPGLIPLIDPLTSLSYGGSGVFITKDLFFSGHTANLFMIHLCLQKKRDKQFALFSAIMVGLFLLIQHVHYTIDIIVALIFTYLLATWAKRWNFLSV